MKNKNKLIILISICVLIIVGIIIISEFHKYDTIRGTILSISNDRIIIVKEHQEDMPDFLLTYYSMVKDDVKTKDIKGRKINISELKVGDAIEVIYKKNKADFSADFLSNIKLINVIGENPREIEIIIYYNSTDNISILINDITTTGISLTIQDNNANPYEYSDEYAIFYNKLTQNDIRDQTSKDTSNTLSSHITNESNILVELEKKLKGTNGNTSVFSEKINKNTIKKVFDWSSVYGELKQRKILF